MNIRKILSIVIVLVLLGISTKNSITVTMDSGEATATCISEPRKSSRRNRLFSIRESRFRYQDDDGNSQEASIWFSIPRPKAGEEVEILYAKKSPKLIYYNSVLFVWMLPAIFGLLLTIQPVRIGLRHRKSKIGLG
ncbi:hypothetical protein N9006_00665 [bacterium]|nr:hypothetical protein [Mariniblastus sp.]MDA7880239.1 hypothetical protein [Mariniblastus sp.]MDA7884807.1 hypothetical protein [bacterium]MDB4391841.1 hypothetical protein [bacterium]MDB4473350.1 hypothetical protein [bacterium]